MTGESTKQLPGLAFGWETDVSVPMSLSGEAQ